MAEMLYAPQDRRKAKFRTVFLAGSIGVGESNKDWKLEVLERCAALRVTFLNPTRTDWDSSWLQEIENEQFKEQVEWELDSLDSCDYIVIYFGKDSQAPISLLEFGLNARSGKVLVCCPKGYWKKGNVDIVCNKYRIKLCETIDEVAAELTRRYGGGRCGASHKRYVSRTCRLS